MSLFPLKATHAPVKAYFAALARFRTHGHTTEGNTRSAFADLLKRCASPYGWHLVEEYNFRGTAKQKLRADGALVDELTLQHGIWEAKDDDDDLHDEVKKKRAAGYPIVNTLFQSPSHAVLYQKGRIAFDDAITEPEMLVAVLEAFLEFEHEYEQDWEEAVTRFSEHIPELVVAMTGILAKEAQSNKTFRERFAAFSDLARQSINPDLSDDAVNKMLVQHLLTERIFRKVFNNPEFTRRNVIAAEIEKVIDSITARHFSRDAFLKPLDRFYAAIERAAEQQEGYTESSTSSTPSTKSSSRASTANRRTHTASSIRRRHRGFEDVTSPAVSLFFRKLEQSKAFEYVVRQSASEALALMDVLRFLSRGSSKLHLL